MNTSDLIVELEGAGIQLWEEAGELRFRAPKGAMTERRRQLLREQKGSVVARLKKRTGDTQIVANRSAWHEPFPLTDVQAAYLLGRTNAFAYGSSSCQVYAEIAYPELDPERLQAAWRQLVERHGMLRAIVHLDGYQQVQSEVPDYVVRVSDLRGADDYQIDAAIDAVRADMDHRAFRPDEWPLFEVRVTLLDDRALLHLSVDFLIADYLSLKILVRELEQLYRDPTAQRPSLDISFRDYLLADRRLRESAQYERDRAYWLERIDALPPAPALPIAERTANTKERFRRLQIALSQDEWAALKRQAGARGITASVAVLSAYAEVLARWCRQPRFSLNLTLLNRRLLHPRVNELVGDFTSVTVLAVERDESTPLAERAAALGRLLFQDMDHRLYSGVEVLRELARRRGRAAALMPAVFTSTIGQRDQSELQGELVHGLSQTPQVWIDCQVVEDHDALLAYWDVREEVFPRGLIDDMFGAFAALLRKLANDPSVWDEVSPVETPRAQLERRAVVNATSAPLPDHLLHQPIVEQARCTPDRLAVVSARRSLRYADLLARASAVSESLSAAGMQPGEPVAIVMDKGWEQVVAVLGVLLAGGAYLPIDTNQPIARRHQILADAGVRRILTQSWLEGDRTLWPEHTIRVAVDTLPPGSPSASLATHRTSPDDVAYVIYTSGSTGTPKGVVISHRAAANTIVDINRRFSVGPDDRVLGLANLGFDLSVYDIFGPLSVGGSIVLPDHSRRSDPSHWWELLCTERVSLWNSVPAQLQMLQHFLDSEPSSSLPALRVCLLSGDWIPVTLPDEFRRHAPQARLISLGGATEASIWSIYHPIEKVSAHWRSIPYGKPLTNQTFHVLDKNLAPVPDLTPGDLYIGGAGLALGYLNDEARTVERFIRHPRTGERLYKTGDLGRYLADGSIEFLGREDRQVKIRGHRIELSEIESVLQSHPGIANATVLADGERPLDRRLCAFVEPRRHYDAAPKTALVADMIVAATAAAEREREGVDCAGFVGFVQQLDLCALLSMIQAFRQSGLFVDERACHTADEVLEAARVAPKHHRLIRGWLTVLEEERLLTRDAMGRYSLTGPIPSTAWEDAWEQVDHPEFEVGFSTELLEYMKISQQNLPQLMRDELGAVALVFPEGRVEVWEATYRNNLLSRYVNRTVAATLRTIAKARTGRDPLRILEVGAGVGGVTVELVPALEGLPVDYLFTDVSPFFVNDARQRFQDVPGMRFGLFDLNQDYRPQGYAPNSFDVIVSAHVMHYAKHAPKALERLRELLAPGGWLVFVDMTREGYQIMTSMMFLGGGQADFEDHRQGQSKTFITLEQWTELLSSAGGETVLNLPGPHDVFAPLGQQVFATTFKTDRAELSPSELQGHLSQRLPEYMVPAHLQLVDAMPLTDNGKVDVRTLRAWLPREICESTQAVDLAEPKNDLERRLAALCAEVLGVKRVGRDQNFFELGGDSLLAARFVGRMREEVAEAKGMFWDSLVRQFMPEPTVAALAAHLARTTAHGSGPAQVPPTSPTPSASAARSPLTVLSEGTEGLPLILVHDGSCALGAYRALLAELGTTRLVLGFEAPETASYLRHDPARFIEVLADEYARLLLERQHKCVHLVGYHSGGVLATEIARRLVDRGAVVERLSVISSFPIPCLVEDDLLSEYLFVRGMGIDPTSLDFPSEAAVGQALGAVLRKDRLRVAQGALGALPVDEHPDTVRRWAALSAKAPSERLAAIGRVASAAGIHFGSDEQLASSYMLFRLAMKAGAIHQVDAYAGDIELLRHTTEMALWPTLGADMTAYWQGICLGDLRIVDIPGDHFDCLSGASASVVRDILVGNRRDT